MNDCITIPVGVTQIELQDWTPGIHAYLWTECGEGNLYKITSVRADWWAVTGYFSWCCMPEAKVYLCETDAQKQELERSLRNHLEARRIKWNSKGEVTV